MTLAPSTEMVAEVHALVEEKLGLQAALDTDLIATGILDSLTLVELLMDLETHFRITISLEDLELDDIRSIVLLAKLVSQRLQPARES